MATDRRHGSGPPLQPTKLRALLKSAHISGRMLYRANASFSSEAHGDVERFQHAPDHAQTLPEQPKCAHNCIWPKGRPHPPETDALSARRTPQNHRRSEVIGRPCTKPCGIRLSHSGPELAVLRTTTSQLYMGGPHSTANSTSTTTDSAQVWVREALQLITVVRLRHGLPNRHRPKTRF